MGFGAEVAAVVQEKAFDWLDAPVERVGARFAPIPFAPVMEEYVVPQARDVLEAIRRTVGEDGYRGQASKARAGHGVRHDRQVAQGRGRPRREGRAALRARHRQGDPGGRGRGLGRPPEDRGERRRGARRADDRGDRRGRRGRTRGRRRGPRPRRRARPAQRASPSASGAARHPPSRTSRSRRSRSHSPPHRATVGASRPRRSRAGSPVTAGSTSRPSPVPVPRAGSSRRTSSAPRASRPLAPAEVEAGEAERRELTCTRKTIARRLTKAWQIARLPAAGFGRHDPREQRCVERLREAEERPESDRHRRPHEGLRRGAHASPRGERALDRGGDPPLPDRERRDRGRGTAGPRRAGDPRRGAASPRGDRGGAFRCRRHVPGKGKLQRADLEGGRSRSRTSACTASSSSPRFSIRRRRRSSRSARSSRARLPVDGEIVVRPMMTLSATFDHRAVDGASAAGFLQTVKELLEEPGLAL